LVTNVVPTSGAENNQGHENKSSGLHYRTSNGSVIRLDSKHTGIITVTSQVALLVLASGAVEGHEKAYHAVLGQG
jgi:hypothetical protein